MKKEVEAFLNYLSEERNSPKILSPLIKMTFTSLRILSRIRVKNNTGRR